jgi:all-trans-8'-apo-beta-carotenal 15,15'-oxygenase
VLYVCCYPAPEKGQPFDLHGSVVGAEGIGECLIGGGLAVLERWRIDGERLERVQVDERCVEYPRLDPSCEGAPFRYGYCVEMEVALDQSALRRVDHRGLLRFDLARGEVAAWTPGSHCIASEPLFVRAVDGRSDDEGWLLTVVDDPVRDGSDIYVLDASSFGRRGPQAVIHLPAGVRLPFRSHGEWVGAERYR